MHVSNFTALRFLLFPKKSTVPYGTDKNAFDLIIFYIRIRHLTRPNKTIDVIYFKNQVRKYLKSTQYLTTTTTKEVCDVNRYF